MTTATCHFCHESFRNSQAVRAHLKACPAYRQLPKANLPKGSAPKAPALGNLSAGTRPTAGRAPGVPRAQSRIDELWADLGDLGDGEEETFQRPDARREPNRQTKQEEAARQREHDREVVRLRAQQEAEARERREATEREARERRRSTIQKVKDQVVGWYSGGYEIPRETEAQALAAIERELSTLPEDLPKSELTTIAEGIRDRIYRPVIQAQDRARAEAERKQHLIEASVSYANRELGREQDLDSSTRWNIEQKVKRILEQEVVADESEADVQARVDEIVDQELDAVDEQKQEKARQSLIAYGAKYAASELDEEDLDLLERWEIQGVVKRELQAEIAGDESEGDVEALVDRILDDELGPAEDDDE